MAMSFTMDTLRMFLLGAGLLFLGIGHLKHYKKWAQPLAKALILPKGTTPNSLEAYAQGLNILFGVSLIFSGLVCLLLAVVGDETEKVQGGILSVILFVLISAICGSFPIWAIYCIWRFGWRLGKVRNTDGTKNNP